MSDQTPPRVGEPDQLRAELTRRERPKLPPPTPLASPNWGRLTSTIATGIEYAERDGYIDKSLKEYIFEAAVEAVYGEAWWPWWNAQDQPS